MISGPGDLRIVSMLFKGMYYGPFLSAHSHCSLCLLTCSIWRYGSKLEKEILIQVAPKNNEKQEKRDLWNCGSADKEEEIRKDSRVRVWEQVNLQKPSSSLIWNAKQKMNAWQRSDDIP